MNEQRDAIDLAIEAYVEECTTGTQTSQMAAKSRVWELINRLITKSGVEPTEQEITVAALAWTYEDHHPSGSWVVYEKGNPDAKYRPGGFSYERMRAALVASRTGKLSPPA